MSKIYLDNAASTPLRKEVIASMKSALSYVGNPSSIHSFGREGRSYIERARILIASLLKAEDFEIIFTSSATEANNFILQESVCHLKVKTIISSPLEHASIIETLRFLEKRYKITLKWVKLKERGDLDLEDLEDKLKKKENSSTLVSLMYANNEIGNFLDIEKVGGLCREYGAFFHSDAVQVVGHYPLDLNQMKLDFISMSAHKFYGPLGIGALLIRKPIALGPLFRGGAQEGGLRAGGENLLGIIGMARALEMSMEHLDKEREYIKELKYYCLSQLRDKLPMISFNGYCDNFKKSLYHLLSLRIPFKDDFLAFKLELDGIAISSGSACSSGTEKISYVMDQLYDKEQKDNSSFLRVSFGIFNDKSQIDKFISTLMLICKNP